MEHLLHCAHCHSEYLHHYKVEVFDRSEDSEQTKKVTVLTRAGVAASLHGDLDDLPDEEMPNPPEFGLEIDVVPSKDAGNPSARRQGLVVTMVCELCGNDTVLTIAQHKGMTMHYFGKGRTY